MMPDRLFVYRAKPERVIDGDTVVCIVDAGFGIWLHKGQEGAHLRLLGVDTPERNEPGWSEARHFTLAWMTEANVQPWPFVIQTQKADSFGRYLATIWRALDGRCLNDDLAAWLEEATP
jgi:endonuclease YncB( thermonuclease family)